MKLGSSKFSRQVTYHKTQVKFAYEWPWPTFKVTGGHSPTVDFRTISQENIFKFVTSRLLIRLTNSLHETGLFFVDWIKKHINFSVSLLIIIIKVYKLLWFLAPIINLGTAVFFDPKTMPMLQPCWVWTKDYIIFWIACYCIVLHNLSLNCLIKGPLTGLKGMAYSIYINILWDITTC